MTYGHPTPGTPAGLLRTLASGLLLINLLLPAPSRADLALWSDLALGRFTKAEKAAEKAIRTERDETALNLTPLCLARSRLKRYDTLFACIDKLEARIAAGDSVVSGFMIPSSDIRPLPGMLRATAWLELNRIREAAESATQALAAVDDRSGSTWGPLPPKGYRVELLTLLGIAHALLGEEALAREDLKRLDELNVADTQPQKYENIRYVGLARIHMALGEYEAALQRMAHEHERWVRGLSDLVLGAGKDSVGTIFDLPKLLIVGKAQAALGRDEEARNSLDTLIAHPRIVDQGDIHWIALFERGRLAERAGRPEEALEYYLRSIEVFERQRSSLTTEASKIGFVGDKQQVYAHAIGVLMETRQEERAFDLVERAKARALVDMLAEKRQFRHGDQAAAQRILTRLDSADLESRALVGRDEEAIGGALRALTSVREELQREAPELASLVTVGSVPLEALRRRLRPDEKLVEFYLHDGQLLLFLLDRERLQTVRLDGAGVEGEIGEFRAALQRGDLRQIRRQGRQLHTRLIAPVAERLAGASLILVPHGALHYLPFAALVAPDGKWFIDRWNYRLLPSASTLDYLPQPPDTAIRATLAIGNPDLGMAEADLPFAAREAQNIAKQSKGSELLLGGEATESRFRALSSRFRRIHFATHGEFRADRPLQSGLLLAQDGDNDGHVSVSEIYDLNLHADLVTLSACETGLGSVLSGDDVVGLTRGFLYAGGRSIVASLWKVADESTQRLMESFYRQLQKGATKQEALRKAQIEIRKAFPNPFHWAAFQLMGGD